MKRLAPWVLILAYVFACVVADTVAFGRPSRRPECEELLPGETPSGELPVCTIQDFLPEGMEFECGGDMDCVQKCRDLAEGGLVPESFCVY